MAKAVAISGMILRCHEDTWCVIHRSMLKTGIWNAPCAALDPSEQHIEVRLSGPKAAAMLHQMRVQTFVGNPLDQAVGRRVYLAPARVLDQADSASPGTALPVVVLDGAG